MRRLALSLFVTLLAVGCSDAVETAPEATLQLSAAPSSMPFEESADAAVEVEAALVRAKATRKLVLINFGANWCPDCIVFGRAYRDPEIAKVLAKNFVTANVDVGNWDKNMEIVEEWDDPIEGGIPAVVVSTADRKILFSTKAGDLSDARNMPHEALVDFFNRLALIDEFE